MKRYTLPCLFFCLLQAIVANVGAQSNGCTGAVALTPGVTCSGTTGNISSTTYTADASAICGTPLYDGWYRFTATSDEATVIMSGIGTGFTNPRLQLLSGACGSLTSIACSYTSGTSQVINAFNLSIGTTYYIRVYSTTASGSAPSSTTGGFSICVVNASRIETSRSYINVSKGTTGGTVGDSVNRSYQQQLCGQPFFPRYVVQRQGATAGTGFSLLAHQRGHGVQALYRCR